MKTQITHHFTPEAGITTLCGLDFTTMIEMEADRHSWIETADDFLNHHPIEERCVGCLAKLGIPNRPRTDMQDFLDSQSKELQSARHVNYSVVPCYAPGSRAQVDRVTARRVAVEERRSHSHALSGCYGPAIIDAAILRGLEGIAYAWAERRGGVEVRDLITGEYREFRRFAEFQDWGKANRARTRAYGDAHYYGR